MTGARGTRRDRIADVAWYVLTALYCVFVLCWLLAGLAAAITAHSAAAHDWAQALAQGEHGRDWVRAGRGLLAGAGYSYPVVDVVLDYVFSGVNLLIAAILFCLSPRDWTVRFLVIGMAGSAGAFNLQAHTAIDAAAVATGWQIGWWHSALLHGVGGVAYVFALLLFPSGTLGWAGRHSWPVRALLITSVAGAIGLLSVSTAEYPHTISFILFFGILTPIAGVTAQLVRSAQATSAEARQQSRVLLWALGMSFAAALVLTVVTLTAQALHTSGLPSQVPGVNSSMPGMEDDFPGLSGLGTQVIVFWIFRAVFTMIPLAIMAGVLRFRLWDAERLFNRALTYAVLISVIGAVYVLGVVRTDSVLGLSTGWVSTPQLVASGLIALAFQPARSWAQRWADRLVYGRRKPAHQVLAEVSALRQASEPTGMMLNSVARILAEGIGAETASVSLDLPDHRTVDYRWPPGNEDAAATQENAASSKAGGADGRNDDMAAGQWRWPVSYRGERAGWLCLPASAERRVAPDRRALLEHLSGQVGVLLHNASLSMQLKDRLRAIGARAAQIRASRWRIVAAQDRERRDLERNLHDGLQPALTAARLTLGLASHLAQAGDLAGARTALDQLRNQVASTLTGLRQTLRGLVPHIASLQELAAALREQAQALGCSPLLQVMPWQEDGSAGVSEGGHAAEYTATPLDSAAATAVYFCCSEALHNSVRHSPQAPVVIRLGMGHDDHRLHFVIADKGPGFDPSAVPRGGGLDNMSDRIGAIGGELETRTTLGEGTQVTGWVPVTSLSIFGRAVWVQKACWCSAWTSRSRCGLGSAVDVAV
jgi:signal transduction histidine kinase